MDDTQIFRGEVSDVPGVYTLPDAVAFLLKAVHAEYVDNGAAADWLPCVTILSDSDHVIARAVDQGVVVTAGDDADVSFFPRVGRAAAASSAAVMAALELGASGVAPAAQTFISGALTRVIFQTPNGSLSYSNDVSPWTLSGPAAGQTDTVTYAQPGLYLEQATLSIGGATFTGTKTVLLNAAFGDHFPRFNSQVTESVDDIDSSEIHVSRLIGVTANDAAVGNVNTQVYGLQASGGNRARDFAHLSIVQLSTAFT